METLRAILKGIGRHRLLSVLAICALIALFLFARFIVSREQSPLSAPIEKVEIADTVYGIGTVTATRSFAVKPGVVTNLRAIYVKEGDAVQKGQRLINVDGVIYRAPFAGVVNYLPFKVGENVFVQIPLLVLTDLTDRYLVVSLEQQGAIRVKAGQKAKLSFDSLRSETFDGTVKSVYSYNGNFLARIDVSHLPMQILPDMTADVAILIQQIPNALVIPTAAFENGYVWVKRGRSLLRRIPVRLGIVDNTKAQILSGDLKPGDRVAIHGKVK